MQGNRRPDGTQPHELEPGEYARAGELGTNWWICAPVLDHRGEKQLGHIAATMSDGSPGWEMTVDDDGALTVSPSIWINKHGDPPGWHGFLKAGVWSTV